MENNEKKKYTKVQIALIVLAAILLAGYIAIIILDILGIIPNLQWVSNLVLGAIWLIIGFVGWGKNRSQAIFDFVLSAIFVVLSILSLI